MKDKKTYWKGLEQLENTPEFRRRATKEFQDYLPINESDEGAPSRRDFLKMMGFGMAAVSLAACEAPVRKAIPYVRKPVDVDPGVANYYASTYSMGNDYCSVVVKTREGRPIKIEGNRLSKVSGGGSGAQVESSVLSLYDKQRLEHPKLAGKNIKWEALDERIKSELLANGGKTVVVSYSNSSPSTRRAIELLKAKYGNVEQVMYDPVSDDGMLSAYEETTGRRMFPLHDFSKTQTIVSFGADFLGAWPNHSMVNRQFARTRQPDEHKKDMSRLYVFESNLSMTGANADYRQPVKPSQEGLYIANLYNLLAKKAGVIPFKADKVEDSANLERAAKDLWNTRGASVVMTGSNDVNVHLLVIAINKLLGNYGQTIDLNKSVNLRQGDDKKFKRFVKELKSGAVGAVIFYNCNPVYDHPLGADIAASLPKINTSISTSDRMDETTDLVKYVAPDHHYLESWNDFEPVTGHLSLSQPTISNIFNTRQAQESFLRWADRTESYYDFVRNSWKPYVTENFDAFWDRCLHDGVYDTGNTLPETSIDVDVAAVASKIRHKYKRGSSGLELVIYCNYSVADGIQANNPWLQELPDPITKACWDNYFTVSPKYAKENGLEYEPGRMEAKLVTLTVNGKSMQLPVLPQPGQAYGTIGVAVGYGRTKAGKVADGIGKNAYELIEVGESLSYTVEGVSISGAEGIYRVAQTQTSHTYAGRETVIQETTLEEYQKDPQAGRYMPEITTTEGKKKPYAVTLWKGHEYANHHWGMMVDLNSCTGCGTCHIACQTENNIPVVGKEEVLNRREMHWIRIDRYYSHSSDDKEVAAENPEVTFQPMMCQQCNSAPCETVCPVAATTHSTEGLNQMTYNRCIGTRYCANNCPYKVRRFNWFKYHDNDQFDTNLAMNNDLGKMVLNPDVTVRSRGVMEKCSFCIQKIQEVKLTAKKERRRPVDADFEMACSDSCPSQAMVFGDMKDPNSKISKMLKIKERPEGVEAQEPRAYHVLEELRVMPNIWYLTKVRNRDENQEKAEA